MKTRSLRAGVLAYALLFCAVGAIMFLAGSARANSVPITEAGAPSRTFLPLVSGGSPQIALPRSYELIEKARQAGQIDDETALLYKVYAAYEDSRLPAQFRGAVPVGLDEGYKVMQEAAARFMDVSPSARQTLFPFFQPPVYVGSWYDRRHFPQSGQEATALTPSAVVDPQFRLGWEHVNTANGKAKVWWHKTRAQDAEVATVVRDLLDNHVWASETNLMNGRAPKSDAGVNEVMYDGQVERFGPAGDGKLDVYLLEYGTTKGQTAPYPPGCEERPVYIILNSLLARGPSGFLNRKYLEAATAHEFLHAILSAGKYAEPCPNYASMEDALANWAIDYVFPANQSENDDYPHRFWAPDYPLFGWVGYEDWVFPYYLSKTYDAGLVRDMANNMADLPPYAAVDAALGLPAGLSDVWHDYAIQLWNRPPWDLYKKQNDTAVGAYGSPLFHWPRGATRSDVVHEVRLGGLQAMEFVLPTQLPALANRYFHFTFPDATVRSVSVFNPFPSVFWPPHGDLKIQALVKVAGRDWGPVEDWTDAKEKFFCFQFAEERLAELVLVMSNGQWQEPDQVVDSPSRPMKLVASNIACKGWRGNVSETHHMELPGIVRHEVLTATDVVFQRDGPGAENKGFYPTKQGQLHWDYSGQSADCRIRATPTDLTIQPDDGGLYIINTDQGDLSGVGQATGSAISLATTSLFWDCPDGTYEEPGYLIQGWMMFEKGRVSPDGMTLAGTYTFSTRDWTRTTQYNFRAIP